jgi:hypothetical protein
MAIANLVAGIAWDPQIRGFLALGVGIVVLLGSVYLLLLTNVGARLGFLIGGAAFWGWMLIMGIIWWVYGTVGMLGTAPHWVVTETVYPGVQQAALQDAHTLDTSALPDPEAYRDLEDADYVAMEDDVTPTLGGWELLPESNPSFGEAKAAVDAYFAANPDEELELAGAEDYISVYSFERGGKESLDDDADRIDRVVHELKTTFWQVQHPPHYAIIQVQPVIKQETLPGEPPPLPEADDSAPVVSVIMERDLGDVRFPAAMLTIASGAMFFVMCLTLHRRDQLVAQNRGLLPATVEG